MCTVCTLGITLKSSEKGVVLTVIFVLNRVRALRLIAGESAWKSSYIPVCCGNNSKEDTFGRQH